MENELGQASLLCRATPPVGPFSRQAGCFPCYTVDHVVAGISCVLVTRTYVGPRNIRLLCGASRRWRLLFVSAVDHGLGRFPRLLQDPLLWAPDSDSDDASD